jgi:hypothetical protein
MMAEAVYLQVVVSMVQQLRKEMLKVNTVAGAVPIVTVGCRAIIS